MVLIHLGGNRLYPEHSARPYAATVLRYDVPTTWEIEDRAHLVKRLNEMDKSAAAPSPEEVEQMINNWAGVFDSLTNPKG